MKKTNALKILISIFAIVVFVSFLFSKKEAFSGYKSTETIQIQNEPYFEEISTKCNNFATNVETNLLDYPNTKWILAATIKQLLRRSISINKAHDHSPIRVTAQQSDLRPLVFFVITSAQKLR